MTNQAKERLLLVMIQLDPKSNFDRLKKTVPAIIELLHNFSGKDMEQVCRSSDGTLFSFFVKSKTHPNIIRAELEKSQITQNNDTFFVIELGESFSAHGFSRAWTWLQRRLAA